ncbi:MAG TPA: peptide ABC transporter [Rhodobacteraceae bacterium]|jgi:peptide/nickel transport system permease protein|nr:peptide ABC transporter [Paracoccaceae bacterium]
MLRYALGRLLGLSLTLFLASVAVFTVVEVIPGDPAQIMLGMEATPEARATLRAELGLDRGPVARYLSWAGGLLRGDLGVSYTYRVPVADLVAERLAVSVPMAAYALILALALGLIAGALAAARRGGPVDLLITGLTQIGIAIPNFWFGMLLVLLFAITLRMFPAGGFAGWQDGPGPALHSLTLPAIALALPQAAILARVMRASLIEVMERDFIRTARAKGLSRGQALRRHGLRNALGPVLTILGLQAAFLLAGAIIIENVFALPGLGRLLFQQLAARDLVVVESVVMLLVFAVVLISWCVDIAYAVADPRLRRR